MELWGGYNFKKIQVMAFLPYVISRKESDDGITNSNGIGDLMILVNYKIYNSMSLSKRRKDFHTSATFFGRRYKIAYGHESCECG